ncbi:glycosyltransferase family 32 [Fusarium heterosporum]|uniref:Glycosyltransferase family 32 n=1 Tax=Fusarium heterosporum TaxID=42747 RepID=A0A8H5THH5_FUSHE|nr:glycosyltransferase family 32 [Fusarium heterosporum]
MWLFISPFTSVPNHYERIEDEEQRPSYLDSRHESPLPKTSRYCKITRKAVGLLIADLVLLGVILHILSPLISLLQHNEELFSARSKVTTGQARKSPTPLDHRIPRIFHQTTKNETIPTIWAKSQASCLDAYSDYEYMLWTDDKARAFLEAEYPWFLNVWDNYPFPIQRADAIRYFVLYHYGGIYLDMDTICHEAFPVEQIELENVTDSCLFEGTLPTGITNDIMISSAKHPAFERATKLLPVSYGLTWWWAKLQPYAAIMSSTGPLFISLAVADYLYDQPSLPSPTVQVIRPAGLKPYISDLQTATWHGWDARLLKWLSDKPLIWFVLGTISVVGGLYIVNKTFLFIFRLMVRLSHGLIRSLPRRTEKTAGWYE